MEDANTILYTTEEVAVRLRIHINTVHRLISSRKLSATLVGTRFRISEAQLQDYLKANTIQPMEKQ